MPFIVHDREALIQMGNEDHDALSLQEGINRLEEGGFTLHSVVDQHRVFAANGAPDGFEGPYFIFHSPELPVRRSGSLGPPPTV